MHGSNVSVSKNIKSKEFTGRGAKMNKEFTIRKSKQVLSPTSTVDSIEPITMIVSEPNFPEAKKLSKDDVFGIFDLEKMEKVSKGMVVASSDEFCPHFGDIVPYKSVTVVCRRDQVDEVSYWLEYVQGAGSITETKAINDLQVALRADYMCW